MTTSPEDAQLRDEIANDDLAVQDQTQGLTDDAVAAYLQNNPDFLIRHPDLIERLTPPNRWSDEGGSVIDMQHYMLSVLKGELDCLRDCAQDVIETSRSNLSSQTRAHAAVLSLLTAGSLEDLFQVTSEELPLHLDVDVVTVCFEVDDPASLANTFGPHVRGLNQGLVEAVMNGSGSVALYKDMMDDGAIFGAAAGLVRSAGIARFENTETYPTGIIAFGSRDEGCFHPGQGTELIHFIARVFESSLQAWLERTVD